MNVGFFEEQLLYFDLNNCHFIVHSRKPQRDQFMLKWQNEM